MAVSDWIKRAILIGVVYLLYLWSWNQSVFGQEPKLPGSLLSITGYLGKDELVSAFSQLKSDETSDRPILLVINSSSGDLNQVLELAKKIYRLKVERGVKVIAYIDDNAIGPAAILPFLADELYTSLFVSWGDIPLGNENVLPTNILRSRVVSLIDPKTPFSPLLTLMASSMSDPAVEIVDDQGWRQAKNLDELSSSISSKTETLVVNHNQLQGLGLVKGVMDQEKFLAMFLQQESEQSTPMTPSTLIGQTITKNELLKQFKKHIAINEKGVNLIGHILIDDRTSGINESTWLYVKKALDFYKEKDRQKPIFVILELNTPGGEVYAAQKISDALKELDTQSNIPVVALIDNWAISAGAMLAYSSRFITTVKDASMGAAEPVIQTESGKMEAASEKVNSAIRADFANRARFFDRDPNIAEAMVDKDMILVKRHGKIIKLDSESEIRRGGPDPDILISPKGKLLTLNAEEMLEFGVADLIIPPTKTNEITSQEKESGKWDAAKMALFHQPYFKEIPNAIVESYRMDWKTRFFVLLAHPVVSSMLFLGLLVGLYLEVSTPGFGIPGTVAVTCLFLIALSSFSLEIANWLELILLLAGIGILFVEIFVLPTFGLLGFIGIVFFFMGLFGMMLPGLGSIDYEIETKTFNAAGEAFFQRLGWLSGTLLIGSLIIAILARFFTPSFAKYSRLVLSGNEQDGYIAGVNPATLPPPGTSGTVVSTLRPAGTIIINDTLYDAVSDGEFIEKGVEIQVKELNGSVIVVTPLKKDT